MNRSDIRELHAARGYPALSILLPTNRASSGHQQNPVRVKNLLHQAAARLLDKMPKREAEPFLERLENLARQIDYAHPTEGLALYVNKDLARLFYLPLPVEERVVVDETFATRDLVYSLNRSPRYWVLVLSEHIARLLRGTRDHLVEITEGGFPMSPEGPQAGVVTEWPGDFGIDRSTYRTEQDRLFFGRAEDTYGRLSANDPLPLAVVGVERNIGFFNEVHAGKNDIIATLNGSHEKDTPAHLGALLWPLVEAGFAARQQDALVQWSNAIGAHRYAFGVGDVWRKACQGRGHMLLVEEEFHYPARVDGTGLHLQPIHGPVNGAAHDQMSDAVDELIEIVLEKKGRVVFVAKDALKDYQHIGLILRY